MHIDFIYVVQGCIKITFSHYSSLDTKEEEELVLRKGEHFDQLLKKKAPYNDYIIERVAAGALHTKILRLNYSNYLKFANVLQC